MKIVHFTLPTQIEEANTFLNSNIILKDRLLEDGSLFIYYKSYDEMGIDDSTTMEALDAMIVQAQKEILTNSIDIKEEEKNLEKHKKDLEEENAKKEVDKNRVKFLEGSIKQSETQIKMSQETIRGRETQLQVLKDDYESRKPKN